MKPLRPAPGPWTAALLAAAAAACTNAEGTMTFAGPVERGEPATFGDISLVAGVDHRSLPRPDLVGYGQGAAVADVDGDGDLDVYLTQDLGPCALYLNDGRGAFTEGAAAAGVAVDPLAAYAKSATFFDMDRDGDLDLFVGRAGVGNRLYRNEGAGTFEDVTAAAGVGGGSAFTVHGAPGDYDGDGWTDLYEVNCVPTDYAAPAALVMTPAPNRLWRNRGDGTFEDRAADLGVADPLAGWAALWWDVDGSGTQDLLVANDRYFYPGIETRDRAFLNGGPGAGFAFADGAAGLGLAESHHGMGFALGDLDGDGLLDLFASDLGGCELRLGADPSPRPDRAPSLGVDTGFDASARHQITWGAAILDFDRDGWNDLLVFNGLLIAEDPGPAFADRQKPRLYLSRPAPPGTDADAMAGGRVFVNGAAAAGLESIGCPGARCALPADLDGDGDLDLVVSTRVGTARILRNDLRTSAPWYGVRLRGTRSAPEGWGSLLEFTARGRTWKQAATAGSQCGGSLPPEWIFSPGPSLSGTPSLTVRWPDGTAQTVTPKRNGWTTVEQE